MVGGTVFEMWMAGRLGSQGPRQPANITERRVWRLHEAIPIPVSLMVPLQNIPLNLGLVRDLHSWSKLP